MTLAETMVDDTVAFDELGKTYGPVLGLVRELLGVVPNCDMYLEIWPPAFRTYNLMVPAFLNLPVLLFGKGAPKDMVGLGMYTSSRAADCMYCSAHTCSFALRRGAEPEAVTGEKRSPAEQAVVDMANALSTIPHTFEPRHRYEVERYFGSTDTEWIGMGVIMMGFLNKFMDAIGVELEASSVADVSDLISSTGWEIGQHGWGLNDDAKEVDGGNENDLPPLDSIAMFARVARLAPGAIRLERQWMKGIPSTPVGAREHLAEEFGIDESLITRTRLKKPAMALAGMLAENLRPGQSTIGMSNKALIAQSFAEVADSAHLRAHAAALTDRFGQPATDDATSAAVMRLVRSISPSPAEVAPTDVIDLRVELSSEQVVETVAWVSVLQLLHRMDLFLT